MRKSFSLNLAAGALGVGLMAAPSFAEIKVSDQLSLSGFIDMSAYGAAPDGAAGSLDASLDQFEIDLLYKFSDKLTARVDLAQGGAGLGTGALIVEQAFLTYTMGPASLTAGRFLSQTGYEAAEPTGMYQWSYSVYCDNTNNGGTTVAGVTTGANGGCLYGGYQNGVNLAYTVSPMISLTASVMGSAAGIASTGYDAGGSTSLKDPAVEVGVAVMPIEGVTVKAFYLYDDMGTDAYNLAQVWGQYAKGPITAAAEFNYFTNFGTVGNDGTAWLAMVNYKLTGEMAVTGRVSGITTDLLGEDETGVTISPSYALASNWLILAEVTQLLDAKTTIGAIETTVTF